MSRVYSSLDEYLLYTQFSFSSPLLLVIRFLDRIFSRTENANEYHDVTGEEESLVWQLN